MREREMIARHRQNTACSDAPFLRIAEAADFEDLHITLVNTICYVDCSDRYTYTLAPNAKQSFWLLTVVTLHAVYCR